MFDPRTRRRLLATVGALSLPGAATAGAADHSADRAAAIVSSMSLDEKLRLFDGDIALDGNGTGTNACVGHIGGVPRLGLPALCMGDGPAGVGNGMAGVTQFPAPIALAASWDAGLAYAFGAAMGAEHAGKGRNVVLAPTINIIRTPLWGRIAETLSEDPLLTAALAVPIVEGIQSNHVIATPKHFVANNQEWLRLGDAPGYEAIDVIVPERALREIYFPAFRAVVEQARAGSLMCAYNRVNGLYACENPLTLGVPRREWGFDGFVVADWYFAHRSTIAAADAGLDISMPGGASPFGFADFYGAPLKDAVAKGKVSPATIDAMALHVVEPMVRLGLLDHPVAGNADADIRSAAHTALARRIAAEGTVLLRNERGILPLAAPVRSIAVIGDDAGPHVQTTERYGGFVRSEGIDIPTPLDAIRARAGRGVTVTYAPGTLGTGALPAMPDAAVRAPDGRPGLRASFFANGDWSGAPALVRDAAVPDAGDVHPASLPPLWSARWEGVLTPPRTGVYRFSVTGGGEIALLIDGKRVVYAPKQNFRSTFQGTIALTAGKAVPIRLDYSRASTISPAELRLGWQVPDPALIERAVAAARASEVAIVFASDMVSEGADRTSLSLPGDQDALIAAVAAANPRTIVVLHTAGPVLMPWKDRVGAILAGWYAGEQAAPALASILFGDGEPSGRLPVTFPASETQMPAASPALYRGEGTVVRYDEGLEVGYRWYAGHGIRPLYPFGFGLSYTTFSFSDATAARLPDGGWAVQARVRNTGSRRGVSVPQLYLSFPAQAGEPPRQLKAFDRLDLAPGETRTVRFTLPPSAFTIWDEGAHAWRAVPGRYRVEIGASSADLPVATTIDATAGHP
ncbi:MAG: glycoside hydrolase family 3 C-terminal domain-containing protein [Sphingomonas bacterium]